MSQPVQDHLRLEFVEGIVVVRFADARLVDEEVVREVGEQLYDLVDERGFTRLLLNFGDVGFLSSAMLGKLMSLRKRLATRGGRLVLCCIARSLREIFHVSGFERLFEIHDDEPMALERLATAAG